ncbi:MAG: hypothetical protein ACK417_09000 [Bacteroidia bacterium]
MRKLLAIILILVLLLPLLGKLLVWGHYAANMKYYAEVLCENQTRPELNCDGQCVLAERLAATQPKAPSAPGIHITQFELSVFVQEQPAERLAQLQPLTKMAKAIPVSVKLPKQVLVLIPAPPPELVG